MNYRAVISRLVPILAAAGLSAGMPSARMIPKDFQTGGYAPHGLAHSVLLERLPAAHHLDVTIGLPLRDKAGLAALLKDLHNPASPSFHKWLTPAEFTARFAPTEESYQKLTTWAQAKGLSVTQMASNRLILSVQGTAADIETAFNVEMHTYRHASGRTFHSPNRAPSLDLAIPIASVTGLNDLVQPVKRSTTSLPITRPGHERAGAKSLAIPLLGSGPVGTYLGNDFRTAYASGVPANINGAGQGIALVEFSSYYPVDPTNYWEDAGIPAPTIIDVPVAGGTSDLRSQDEVSMDIEVVGAMANGATIYVYQGTDGTAILNQIVQDNLCKSVGCSWGWTTDAMTDTNAIDTTQDAILQQMDAQGIAMFVAAGDNGTWVQDTGINFAGVAGNPMNPADNPSITCVGGTQLLTNYANAPWTGETVWPQSGGGSSLRYALPSYQTSGIDWTGIPGASATKRNCPDVAAIASDVYATAGNGLAYSMAGTSCAAPLWAAFAALANQTAVATGNPTMGSFNQLIYSIGEGANYGSSLHDIVSGSNGLNSAPGFDMATGWGSPIGQTTINGLIGVASTAPSITTQPQSAAVAPLQTTTFSVTATGTALLTYQWQKNGTAIPGAMSPTYLTQPAAGSDNGAQFTVVVTNEIGSVTSSAATLTVTLPGTAPSISAPPQPISVTAGQTATFSVTAAGTAPFTYQWRKNGNAITGATASSYTTPATVLTDNASQFSVTVTNGLGSTTSGGAILTVNPASGPGITAPAITVQPQPASVVASQTATFSVTATGTALLTYQWLENGVAIAGATGASYTTPAMEFASNGALFTVVVTNTAGTTTSNAAKLTVSLKSMDIAGEGTVDVMSLAGLAAAYGTNNSAADLNGDSIVNDADVAAWINAFGGNL